MLLFLLFLATAAATPMQSLDFLVGEWDGSGWIVLGPNGRQTFAQHESVRYAAGGSVVVIDGLGTGTSDAMKGKVVHQAFAVVSYDAASKAYNWRAWRAGGEEIAVKPEIGDRRLVWGFKDPRGVDVRFTIKLTDAGEWHEVGEVTRDGSSWTQFFEMTLKRR